jgi:tetratricopeptide (TPR) repeat protein
MIEDRFVKMLPSSFPPLSFDESLSEWGKEYQIALAFAEQLDLYRAVTTFKRSEILMPVDEAIRRRETQYYTLLCYYLGKRYDDVIDLFNESDLRFVSTSFSTYHDLLVILYESYMRTNEDERAMQYHKLLRQHFPDTAEKLFVSTALNDGKLDLLEKWVQESVAPINYEDVVVSAENFYARPETTARWIDETDTGDHISSMMKQYALQKKSTWKAQALNAVVPGAGYLYVGQKQSALTSLLLNSLFIGAAYGFFSNGYTAAGLITTSFELGWYFGGIYGSGQAAKLYNERIYERVAFNTMQRDKLFPVLNIQHGF